MTREDLIAEHGRIVAAHGPWGSHNVALPFGLHTIDSEPRGDNHRVVKFLQMVQDLLRRPLAELRVLDLGCGEGLYAVEFAQQGAAALGVEGRAANFAKAEFARAALGLDRLSFVQGDVRDVTLERFGPFDVVLCSGLLYHLDAPAVFEVLAQLRRLCTGVLIIDTRIALSGDRRETWQGREYLGATYREHAPGASTDVKLAQLGASLDNDESFWFTRRSVVNLLADLGFSSVFECQLPVPLKILDDRITLAAVPGAPVQARNALGDLHARRWPPA